jgi:hypothetical protein
MPLVKKRNMTFYSIFKYFFKKHNTSIITKKLNSACKNTDYKIDWVIYSMQISSINKDSW